MKYAHSKGNAERLWENGWKKCNNFPATVFTGIGVIDKFLHPIFYHFLVFDWLAILIFESTSCSLENFVSSFSNYSRHNDVGMMTMMMTVDG